MANYFLMALLQRSPFLLIILVGILFSIVRWRRHPKASLLTLIALGFYLAKLFVFTSVNYAIPTLRESMQWSYGAANNLYSALHVLNDIGFSIVLILLVAAAFANRRPITATNN